MTCVHDNLNAKVKYGSENIDDLGITHRNIIVKCQDEFISVLESLDALATDDNNKEKRTFINPEGYKEDETWVNEL